MAMSAGSGGAMPAVLGTLAAAVVGVTITSAVVTAGLQHELEAQDCSSGPAQNLVSQPVPGSEWGSGGGGATIDGIPPDYMELYSSAASEYGLDVYILAAVGYVETKHGTATATSYAGAQGPMQFMPETWQAVGYDANGDGTADIQDPEDAIPSAAKYLRDSGAPEDYHGALLAYNNAEWYVNEVLQKAEEYRAEGEGGGGSKLALLPVAVASEAEGVGGSVAGVVGGFGRLLAAPLGMDPAFATEQGWDLVDDELNVHYEDYSSYGAEVQNADDVWSSLGTVNVEPSPGGSETDVQVGDASLPPGVSGRTSTDGTVLLDIKGDYPGTAVAHEFGHVLRLGHDPRAEGLMDQDPSTHPTAPTAYDEEVYYSIWGQGGGGGTPGGVTPVSNDASAGAAQEEAAGEAVFPLPEEDFGSFSDTWGDTTEDGRVSEGTDFEAAEGTQVSALVGGKVVQHNGGSTNTVMIESDSSVGTVREGDMVFYSGLGEKGVGVGDTVEAGQQIGSVGSGDGGKGGLHLGLYDPSGERAEAASGAMNPFPMLNWLKDQGGKASGTAAEGPACEAPESSQTGGAAPGAAPSDGGAGPSGGTTSGSGSAVVAEAEKYLGVPYLLGGPEACVPGETMDCTCLTTTVYGEFGYSLPDMPQSTLEYGEPVDEPAPGDLVVFPDPGDGTGGHVGIATGNGQMIHACLPCGETVVGNIADAGTPNGYRRLVQ